MDARTLISEAKSKSTIPYDFHVDAEELEILFNKAGSIENKIVLLQKSYPLLATYYL